MSRAFAVFGIFGAFGVLNGTFEVAVDDVVGEGFAVGGAPSGELVDEVEGTDDELVDGIVRAFGELVGGAGPAGNARGMTFGELVDGAGGAGSAR